MLSLLLRETVRTDIGKINLIDKRQTALKIHFLLCFKPLFNFFLIIQVFALLKIRF